MVSLLAERFDTKSNVKLGGFRSQLQASYVLSHTEEFWYNETVCRWMTIYIYIPYAWTGCNTRSILMDVTGLNSEFFFFLCCHSKVEKPSLPSYLSMDGERIVGFIAFLWVYVLYKMKAASSGIWTKFIVLDKINKMITRNKECVIVSCDQWKTGIAWV